MRKLLENSFLYVAVEVLQKGISFFMLPIYTAYLSPRDYGIVELVYSITIFISLFYTLGMTSAITRYYYKYKDKEPEYVKELWGSCFTFVLCVSFTFTLVLILFHEQLINPFAKGISFFPYILLGMLNITINPAFTFYQASLQARQKGKRYSINGFVYFLINISLSIFFVVVMDWKATGLLLAHTVTAFIFFLYTLLVFIPQVKMGFNRRALRESLGYSLPLVPHQVSGWTISMIDRVFINNMITTGAVGIYSIGATLGGAVHVISGSIHGAYTPWFFERVEERDNKSIENISSFIITIYAFLAMCLSLFSRDILYIMVSSSFQSAWKVIPFIAYAFVFHAIYLTCCNSLFIDKTKYIPFITVTSAVINVILNYLLIPKWGIIGAGVASMIAKMITSIITMVVALRLLPVKYKWIKMYGLTFICFSISVLDYYLVNMPWLTAMGIKLSCVVVVFLIILFAHRKQVSTIIPMIKRVRA